MKSCGFFSLLPFGNVLLDLLKEGSLSFLFTNDWKPGGSYFWNVLFVFTKRCLQHVLFLIVSIKFSWAGSKSKFGNYFRVAITALGRLLFSLQVLREAATYDDTKYTELISEPFYLSNLVRIFLLV
jgi:hypothetical protein